MMKMMGRSVASLAVGAAFGLAMSMELPDPHAIASGAAAAAFMYGGFVYNGRIERRQAEATREDRSDGEI